MRDKRFLVMFLTFLLAGSLLFLAVGNVVAALLDQSEAPVTSSIGTFQQDPELNAPIEQPTDPPTESPTDTPTPTESPTDTPTETITVLGNSATASWEKCSSEGQCVYTFVIASDQLKNGKTRERTLSLYETTYKGGKFVSDRGGFAKNVDFEQTPLMEASVNADVKVSVCDADNVCEEGGAVRVNVSWKGQGSPWVDTENTRFGEPPYVTIFASESVLRDATATGSVDGQRPGSLQYAVLAENAEATVKITP
jgi:hypothetical protein